MSVFTNETSKDLPCLKSFLCFGCQLKAEDIFLKKHVSTQNALCVSTCSLSSILPPLAYNWRRKRLVDEGAFGEWEHFCIHISIFTHISKHAYIYCTHARTCTYVYCIFGMCIYYIDAHVYIACIHTYTTHRYPTQKSAFFAVKIRLNTIIHIVAHTASDDIPMRMPA